MRKLSAAWALLVAIVFSASAGEEGLASWYAGKFQGRRTASGEIFDTNRLTAAHKSLPFGTLVKVVNLENQREVVVRINDRGPFVAGRVIDLSRAAAEGIGMTAAGVAPVRLEIISGPAPQTFTVQIGAYGQEENARRTQASLSARGLSATLVPTRRGIIRVQVQNVTAGELERTRAQAAAAGFDSLLVIPDQLPAD